MPFRSPSEVLLNVIKQGGPMDIPGEGLPKEEGRSQGELLYALGKIHYDKSDLESAAAYFRQALDLCSEARDFYFEFKVLGFLIRIASEMLDNNLSELYIERSDFITQRAINELGTLDAEVFYNEGIIKTYHGHFDQATQNFDLATTKAQEEKSLEVLAKVYYAMATSCYHKKSYEPALNYLNQLSYLLNSLNRTYFLGTMYLLQGNIYSEMGDYDGALKYYDKANENLLMKKCWNLYSYILLGKGAVFKRMGRYDRALWFFQVAQEAADPAQFKRLHLMVQLEITNVNDSTVDIHLDFKNRVVKEKTLGTIYFKHRFVLLEILLLLAKSPGAYYSKHKLTDSIWGQEYNPLVHDKLIYTSISRLRKLIEPPGKKGKYIIRGREGYSFNPNVNARFNEDLGGTVKTLANVDMASPV